MCLLLLLSRLVVSDSVQPCRRQPTRLPCPWDSPGKNSGMGCHFLLHCNLQCKNSAPPQTLLTSGFSAGWSTRMVHGSTALPGGSDSKVSACNSEDPGLIPGLGRSAGEGGSTHFHILTWRTHWIEEPGGLQSMGSQRVGHN